MSKEKLERKLYTCPECGSGNLIEDFDQGEISCQNCGLVISEHKLSTAPEWRAFTKEESEKRSRTGMPTSFSIHDKGLSTVIQSVGKDAYGRSLSQDRRREMFNLSKWQRRSRPQIERNLVQAMAEIDRVSDILHIPKSIRERGAVIYRKALDEGLVIGRSIAAIASASLYAACRSSETPRTLKEVSEASGLKRKDLARCYRLILKELEIKMPIEDPLKCVSKIASRARLTPRTQMRALEILREAKRIGVAVGKDPMGIAAAALYVACIQEGEKKTQNELAEAANVTEVTVRNRYKNLRETLDIKMSYAPLTK